MSFPRTFSFGTYSFPNQTFEALDHPLAMDTPELSIRRRDGGVVLRGYAKPKRLRINGKVWEGDRDALWSTLNIMQRALHNAGAAAQLKYRDDRYVTARLAREGISQPFTKGLHEYLVEVDLTFVAQRPYAESTTQRTVTGSRTNNSSASNFGAGGHYPSNPVFTFVGGTWPFSNDIYVLNTANSHSFRYAGPIAAGQTLVVDCDLGCVLLHSGAQMIDAISRFSGDLFFEIVEGGTNSVVVDAATLNFTALYRDRYYL